MPEPPEILAPQIICPGGGFAVFQGMIVIPTPLNMGVIQTLEGPFTDPVTGCTRQQFQDVMYVDAASLISNQEETICLGDVVIVEGQPFSAPGNYSVPGTSPDGCVTTTFLDLTVLTPIAAIIPPTAPLSLIHI